MRKNKIDVYEGSGTVDNPNMVKVDLNDGEEAELQTKNIIVATGARPRSIPGVEIDGDRIITYKEAIFAEKLPEKVVIIGAGPIGIEFAYIWVNYGVDVTVLEMLDHLLPNEDPEVSETLEKAYKKLGVEFRTGVRVESVSSSDDGLQVAVDSGDSFEADQVLVAVGFQPNVESIGIDELDVQLNEWGGIKIDEGMRTNVPNIYAIGDVVAPEGIMLAHIGSAMGIVAAETIAGHPTISLNYLMLPRCTYSVPQVASFGFTEEQAKEAGFEINVGRFPFQANGKALGLGEREGFVKIISDARYGEILGAHMIGPEVTELLPELTLAQFAELTAEEIARNVHAHPTLAESLMEAAHGVEGETINA
jgi:dihydrolipoamide dehydrogenase